MQVVANWGAETPRFWGGCESGAWEGSSAGSNGGEDVGSPHSALSPRSPVGPGRKSRAEARGLEQGRDPHGTELSICEKRPGSSCYRPRPWPWTVSDHCSELRVLSWGWSRPLRRGVGGHGNHLSSVDTEHLALGPEHVPRVR